MTGVPLYGDLKDMKGRSTSLVRNEMTRAVELLSQAGAARGADLETTFAALRLSRDEERSITGVTAAARAIVVVGSGHRCIARNAVRD